MKNCPACSHPLTPVRLACGECGIKMEGEFRMPRLARLSKNSQELAESFILFGGNLKDLSADMDISYPTLRKRIDDMIAELSTLQKRDEEEIHVILDRIEKGEIKAEEGMRLIKEMNNEL